MASTIQAAALSNVGKVRRNNQDSGYAGRSLFVVADGMGGHAGGDIASAMAVKHLVSLDHDFGTADEATEEMQRTITAANSVLTETVYEHPELTGMGTTVSAIIKVGDSMALAHIGDSRVYLYRDGEISQITADHTFVQRLVDSGRITQEEAAVHPRRSVLMRVLGDVDSAPEVDLSVLATRPGDRWVLCSDGLTGVVPNAKIALALSRTATPQAAAETLVKESLEGGAPDNVTVLVVDVVADAGQEPPAPVLVGSAEAPLEFTGALPQRAKRSALKFSKPASVEPSHFESASENYLDELIDEDNRRRRRRRITWSIGILALIAGLAFATFLAYQWTQTRFFVGTDGTHVVIYRGIQQDLGPITLHQEEFVSQTKIEELSPDMRSRVEHTITAQDLRDAETIVKRLDESTE